MKGIKLDTTAIEGFIGKNAIEACQKRVSKAHKALHDGTGLGSDYLGWLKLPIEYDKDEFENILVSAQEIKADSDVLIVTGIGGSYLGARAAIDALNHSFYNNLSSRKRKAPLVLYAGNSLSPKYLSNLFTLLEGKDVSVNVISKSGTTTEPAITFRFLKDYMEKRYGKKIARKRIYATTDKNRGALKTLADEESYTTFEIPDNVGGRFSILTSVGLLPIACTNADIIKIMNGAADAYQSYINEDINENDCYLYAALRNLLYESGKKIEIMVNYEPTLHFFTEWWKQLYGESEGKDKKGIFPAGVDFTTDLHSMGQYIQDGERHIFETVLNIEEYDTDLTIKADNKNLDGLNYLQDKTLGYVNSKAMEATVQAHVDGKVPNMVVNVPKMNSYNFGRLVYFFEKACGISGYMLGVNPFDQPGVEAYKKNMFRLLGKPS